MFTAHFDIMSLHSEFLIFPVLHREGKIQISAPHADENPDGAESPGTESGTLV